MKNKYEQPETSSMVCRRSFKYNRTSFHLGAGRPHPDQKNQPVKEKDIYNIQYSLLFQKWKDVIKPEMNLNC